MNEDLIGELDVYLSTIPSSSCSTNPSYCLTSPVSSSSSLPTSSSPSTSLYQPTNNRPPTAAASLASPPPCGQTRPASNPSSIPSRQYQLSVSGSYQSIRQSLSPTCGPRKLGPHPSYSYPSPGSNLNSGTRGPSPNPMSSSHCNPSPGPRTPGGGAGAGSHPGASPNPLNSTTRSLSFNASSPLHSSNFYAGGGSPLEQPAPSSNSTGTGSSGPGSNLGKRKLDMDQPDLDHQLGLANKIIKVERPNTLLSNGGTAGGPEELGGGGGGGDHLHQSAETSVKMEVKLEDGGMIVKEEAYGGTMEENSRVKMEDQLQQQHGMFNQLQQLEDERNQKARIRGALEATGLAGNLTPDDVQTLKKLSEIAKSSQLTQKQKSQEVSSLIKSNPNVGRLLVKLKSERPLRRGQEFQGPPPRGASAEFQGPPPRGHLVVGGMDGQQQAQGYLGQEHGGDLGGPQQQGLGSPEMGHPNSWASQQQQYLQNPQMQEQFQSPRGAEFQGPRGPEFHGPRGPEFQGPRGQEFHGPAGPIQGHRKPFNQGGFMLNHGGFPHPDTMSPAGGGQGQAGWPPGPPTMQPAGYYRAGAGMMIMPGGGGRREMMSAAAGMLDPMMSRMGMPPEMAGGGGGQVAPPYMCGGGVGYGPGGRGAGGGGVYVGAPPGRGGIPYGMRGMGGMQQHEQPPRQMYLNRQTGMYMEHPGNLMGPGIRPGVVAPGYMSPGHGHYLHGAGGGVPMQGGGGAGVPLQGGGRNIPEAMYRPGQYLDNSPLPQKLGHPSSQHDDSSSAVVDTTATVTAAAAVMTESSSSSPQLRARLSGGPVTSSSSFGGIDQNAGGGGGGIFPSDRSSGNFLGGGGREFNDRSVLPDDEPSKVPFIESFSRSQQNAVDTQTEQLFQELEKYPFNPTAEYFTEPSGQSDISSTWKGAVTEKRMLYLQRLEKSLETAGIQSSEVKTMARNIENEAFSTASTEEMYEKSLISTLARYIPENSNVTPDSTTRQEGTGGNPTSTTRQDGGLPTSTTSQEFLNNPGTTQDSQTENFFNNTTQAFQELSEKSETTDQYPNSPTFPTPSTSKFDSGSPFLGGGVIVPRTGGGGGGRHLSVKLSTNSSSSDWGKSNSNSNNNNQPNSVDSGIGSPRSLQGALYSPKVQCVSPCVGQSDISPEK